MNNYKRDLREVTKKYKYKLRLKGINEEQSLKEGEREKKIYWRRGQNKMKEIMH
jgi:hypothetical protein